MKIAANCNRKSHRLNIPIQVIMKNTTCEVLDWSTAGMRVSYSADDIAVSDELEISIILPTGSSAIVLDAKVVVRNIAKESCGLEIVELSEKNQRVLRHYATLAIDGNKNQIDDLSSDLFMQTIHTPIKEPILLTDKEHKEVHKSFLRHSLAYFTFGSVFLFIVLATLLYNYLVVYSGIGLVSGNSQNYKAPYDGVLKELYVKIDQKVAKGQLLFEMQSSNDKEMLQALRLQQATLQTQLGNMKKTLSLLQKEKMDKSRETKRFIQKERKRLIDAYKIQKETYERAQYLYNKKLITFAKYAQIQNQYLAFMDEYNNSVLYNNPQSREKKLSEQQLMKIEDQIIQIKRAVSQLNTEIQKLALETLQLKQKIKSSTVLATQSGIVHNIFHQNGEQLEYSDDVLTLQTFKKPYLLTKMTADKIAAVHIGEPCLLYSKRLNKTFYAKVAGIGYSVTESLTTNTTEISQNEIPIKIEFQTQGSDLELNEYLEVYFLNDSPFARELLYLLPQSMLVL